VLDLMGRRLLIRLTVSQPRLGWAGLVLGHQITTTPTRPTWLAPQRNQPITLSYRLWFPLEANVVVWLSVARGADSTAARAVPCRARFVIFGQAERIEWSGSTDVGYVGCLSDVLLGVKGNANEAEIKKAYRLVFEST